MAMLALSILPICCTLQLSRTPHKCGRPLKVINMGILQHWKKHHKKFGLMIREDPEAVFKEHIREHAVRYFPGFEPEQTRVELMNKQERVTALLYQFAVRNGVQVHTVFVKVFDRSSPNRQGPRVQFEKPLLFPKADAEERHRLQYTAHKTIYDYFTSLDKEHLGAIRVLDYLPQHCAILTEGVSEPPLRKLLLRKNRFFTTHSSDDLLPAFQNVGKWLRLYHTMPKKVDVKIRDSKRDDYIGAVNKLTDFLVKTVGHEAFFRENALTIINTANEFLPASLPLGLGHGDFALRNIFVGENARVIGFDTLAYWRTPIYKDIGFFLNDLKLSNARGIRQGFAFGPDQLMAYESSFLKGYFDDNPVPYAEIRLYETFALLDRWSSSIAKSFQKQAFLKVVSWPRMIFINRYSKKRLKSLLGELRKMRPLLNERMMDSQRINSTFQ
jgi:hypothetical protein